MWIVGDRREGGIERGQGLFGAPVAQPREPRAGMGPRIVRIDIEDLRKAALRGVEPPGEEILIGLLHRGLFLLLCEGCGGAPRDEKEPRDLRQKTAGEDHAS